MVFISFSSIAALALAEDVITTPRFLGKDNDVSDRDNTRLGVRLLADDNEAAADHDHDFAPFLNHAAELFEFAGNRDSNHVLAVDANNAALILQHIISLWRAVVEDEDINHIDGAHAAMAVLNHAANLMRNIADHITLPDREQEYAPLTEELRRIQDLLERMQFVSLIEIMTNIIADNHVADTHAAIIGPDLHHDAYNAWHVPDVLGLLMNRLDDLVALLREFFGNPAVSVVAAKVAAVVSVSEGSGSA